MNKTIDKSLETVLKDISLPAIEYLLTHNYELFATTLGYELSSLKWELNTKGYAGVSSQLQELAVSHSSLYQLLCDIRNIHMNLNNEKDLLLECVQHSNGHCSSIICEFALPEERATTLNKVASLQEKAAQLTKASLYHLIDLINKNYNFETMNELSTPAGLADDYAITLNKLFETNDIKLAEKELEYWQGTTSSDVYRKVLLTLRYDYLNYIKNQKTNREF